MNKSMYIFFPFFFFLQLYLQTAYCENEKFIVITTLYNEKNEDRLQEYITCLNKHLHHNLIDTVHIVYDTSADEYDNYLLNFLRTNNFLIDYVSDRPTYGYLFGLANRLYPNRIVIVCNADIYFNDTLDRLRNYNFCNRFLALTRWNIQNDGLLKKEYRADGRENTRSQDVWIFQTPLRKFGNDRIKIGIMGCDAAIAHEALAIGLEVLNPCLTIQCCHLHLTRKRNYDVNNLPYPSYPNQCLPWISL